MRHPVTVVTDTTQPSSPVNNPAQRTPPLVLCCACSSNRSVYSASRIGVGCHWCELSVFTMRHLGAVAQAAKHLFWLSFVFETQCKAARIQPCALPSKDLSFCRPIHDSFPGDALHIGFVAGGEDRWPDLSTALISLLHYRSCPLHIHFYADIGVQTLIEDFFRPAEYAPQDHLITCLNAPACCLCRHKLPAANLLAVFSTWHAQDSVIENLASHERLRSVYAGIYM